MASRCPGTRPTTLAAVLNNLFVLKRVPGGAAIFREGEARLGGIVLYPIVVLVAALGIVLREETIALLFRGFSEAEIAAILPATANTSPDFETMIDEFAKRLNALMGSERGKNILAILFFMPNGLFGVRGTERV